MRQLCGRTRPRAEHPPDREGLFTCSSCLMVFSCWLCTFSCSRALDSSSQTLSFRLATPCSPTEAQFSSSRFCSCSLSTSCFSFEASCSFCYKERGRGMDGDTWPQSSPGRSLPLLTSTAVCHTQHRETGPPHAAQADFILRILLPQVFQG